ncbi:hypothetical protein CFC21_107206 [Triticum aestivum]|uniref:TF-B3 domain-containing protein n=2 Tax=Triticum aestivum TaxID=4565 RepID=A0A3B6TDE5_WHEAT|nr:putative B3 domain-containing protein Os08g0325100 isoform X1 [Triticum aestivum]XP_044441965.1 putative B3 domain-containing protein Os08g0325100 isoform X1 [Triticum aestivum]KAF7106480.1 hypothetical protein CFC21_107206 [Triticum aestivum]
MCTSCESCKRRDEYFYRNLDDEKKYFLVLMIGDFRDEMIIPEELVQRFKREILGEIKLETRNGDNHAIVVAKIQEKRIFTVGWRQFVANYDLQIGDLLMFRYKGNSQFNVIIFDKLGREKASSVVLDPFIPRVQDRGNEAHEIGSSEKMDVQCGRCNNWLEYHYADLDNENKYFLMLMMGDFQYEMIIPEGILERFKGEFPREIKLETQNRRSYKIGVAENKLDTCYNQKLVFSVGWGEFIETFGLQTDDMIVLIYNGNSQFSVIIFDKHGCEKALSVIVDPVPPPVQERRPYGTDIVKSSHFHSQPMQRQPFIVVNGLPVESPPTEGQWRAQLEMDKSCQGSMAAINTPPSESSGLRGSLSSEHGHGVRDVPVSSNIVKRKAKLSSSQKEQLRDGYITAHKTKLTSTQKDVVKQKVQSIESKTLIFVAVMYKCNVESPFFLTFPNYYAQKYLGEEARMHLELLGVKWQVRFPDNRGDKKLKHGWRKFAQGNNLKMGDICLFELLSNQSTMVVYVIPANDANVD